MHDALVIGGGFYGCVIAMHLVRRGFPDVMLVEREDELLTRASYRNQARVHNGYHYPRSFVTAYRSRVNEPRFRRDYDFAVAAGFTKLYAIASRRSRVTPNQFERFMTDIGASFARARAEHRALFEARLIAAVYEVEEVAFDARLLRCHFDHALAEAGVDVRRSATVTMASPRGDRVVVELSDRETPRRVQAALVVNCTYGRLNHCFAAAGLTPLKHEITEIALVVPPPQLKSVGVTVMDGPFFSCMPFPAESCHSLSHVRYTPHGHFIDQDGARDPLGELAAAPPRSRVDYMIADAARYLPCLRAATPLRSLFEVKTVLMRNEADDGRPILMRREAGSPRLLSVLGGKIDNIYDALEELDRMITDIPAAMSATASAPIA
jgi:glycine/D-amino acid oxidase-like deaminating enzyme